MNLVLYICISAVFLMTAPLAPWLTSGIHPCYVCLMHAWNLFIPFVVWLIIAATMPGVQGMPLMIVSVAYGFGTFGAANSVSEVLLTAWMCDEDQIKRYVVGNPLPVRRDGVFAAIKVTSTLSGALWTDIAIIILGAAGFDGNLETQSEFVKKVIFGLFYTGTCLIYLSGPFMCLFSL